MGIGHCFWGVPIQLVKDAFQLVMPFTILLMQVKVLLVSC